MSDLFGHEAPSRPFRDIRNTRSSVAEEKAQLVLILGRHINTVPMSVRNGSVNLTRDWRTDRDAAAKVAKSSRSFRD